MFFGDKELEVTVDFTERKIDDLLSKGKTAKFVECTAKAGAGSDANYIRDLQTLVILKDAANQKIQRIEENRERRG